MLNKKKLVSVFSSPFGKDQDIAYMKQALALAQEAYIQGEVPIGALVVNKEGIVIGAGSNKTEFLCTQSAHAEIMALTAAGVAQKGWRLTGCWLYVTLEPCLMCMGLVCLSRLSGIVYGASSPLFGGHLDSLRILSVYKVDAVSIIGGVCREEAGTMLKDFFKEKRRSDV